ncbi:MAG: pyridoxamine 5'-phosphate oxidase family protein [Gammaproteobacteria bacterium]|nr:pyridoxamine 5'-phosphate oxidase family protein [Gammaproteobacteria bacterium]
MMADATGRAAIARLLAGHRTLTLATSHQGRPWAATVFYASDAAFNLFFVSDPRTRHARDMAVDPRVALCIDADAGGWDEVRGLQIEGEAMQLAEAERPAALALYLARFPDVQALHARPETADEQLIARRLQHTPFWRVKPRLIRLLDSAHGFGWKWELQL